MMKINPSTRKKIVTPGRNPANRRKRYFVALFVMNDDDGDGGDGGGDGWWWYVMFRRMYNNPRGLDRSKRSESQRFTPLTQQQQS